MPSLLTAVATTTLTLTILPASLTGKLHGATTGRLNEYLKLRRRLGTQRRTDPFQHPWPNARGEGSAKEISEVVALFRRVFDAAGVRPDPAVGDEIEHVAGTVEGGSGAFSAFCQGDQNLAADCIRVGGQLRLLDFGESGYRHALIEGIPGRMTWGCMMRIPSHIIPRMDSAYRNELIRGYPDAA